MFLNFCHFHLTSFYSSGKGSLLTHSLARLLRASFFGEPFLSLWGMNVSPITQEHLPQGLKAIRLECNLREG